MVAACPTEVTPAGSLHDKLVQLKKLRRLQVGVPASSGYETPRTDLNISQYVPEHSMPLQPLAEETHHHQTLSQEPSVHWAPNLELWDGIIHVPGTVQEPTKPILKSISQGAGGRSLQLGLSRDDAHGSLAHAGNCQAMLIKAFPSTHPTKFGERLMHQTIFDDKSCFLTSSLLPAKRSRNTAFAS